MGVTKHQKEFILTFFKDERFAGWKNIAKELIDNGSCIVAGEDCIWKGGIGNFITVEETEEAVGCVRYSFNLSEFISSAWFVENTEAEVEDIEKELQEIRVKELETKEKYKGILGLKIDNHGRQNKPTNTSF